MSPQFKENLSRPQTDCFLTIYNIYTDDVDSVLPASVILCLINTLASVVAVLGNSLIIFSVVRTSTLHTPSNVFLCSLAITDFLTGLITQPLFVSSIIGRVAESYSFYCTASVLSFLPVYIMSGVSFLTLTAISIDRFLALRLHLRYRTVVTIQRVLIVELAVWIFSVVVTTLPLAGQFSSFQLIIALIISTSLLLNILAYWYILQTLQRHKAKIAVQELQLGAQSTQETLMDAKKVKRSSWTMLAVFCLFFLCYIPTLCLMVAGSSAQPLTAHLRTVRDSCATVVLINASFNPILYYYRMKDIRRAVSASVSFCSCFRKLVSTRTVTAVKQLQK